MQQHPTLQRIACDGLDSDFDSTGRVTLYLIDSLLQGGYLQIEASRAQVRRVAYAQYNTAVELTYRPKRARHDRQIMQTFQPTLVILEGWGHFQPDEYYTPGTVHEGQHCTVTQGAFRGCAGEWRSEFTAMLDAYVAETGAKVVRDYRGANVGEQCAKTGTLAQ